jgi:CRP-like cAMP-binding protein
MPSNRWSNRMISKKALDVLRATSLFADFTDEQLEMVPKVGRERHFEPGETIVEEGDTDARSLWLVLEGEVDVVVAGEVLRTMGAGTHFGEMALLTGAPRSADIVARKPTVALELTQNHLNGLIGANPQVAIDMLAVLATRLRRRPGGRLGLPPPRRHRTRLRTRQRLAADRASTFARTI